MTEHGSYTMKFARLSVLSASVLIAACGGSSGSQFAGAETSVTTFAITASNATLATRLSWEAAIASGGFGQVGGYPGLTTTTSDGFAKPAGVQKAAGTLVDIMPQAPFGPDVTACLVDGTVTNSGDVADPLTISTDDTFRVQYDFCDDGYGEVINGIIDFTVREFTGDLLSGLYMVSMDAIVTNLQILTGTDTVTSNGDATVSLDYMQSPLVSAGISGTSMIIDSNSSSETLRNYSTNQTIDGGMQELPYTMTASGTLDTTQLGGTVRYSTPATFTGEGLDYPSAGSLLVQGEGSSSRLTAVDNVNVTIEVDTNGDGDIDNTINTTWVDLLSP